MSMREAVARFVPDGASICMGAALEALIPFAAGHELIRQRRRDLTLIGPISDILFDQLIGAGCVRRVIAAWVGNVSAGLGYNYRRAVEQRIPAPIEVQDHSNLTIASALQAAALGAPYLPTRSLLGTDLPRANPTFKEARRSVVGRPARSSCPRSPPTWPSSTCSAPTRRATRTSGAPSASPARPPSRRRRVILVAEEIRPRERILSDPGPRAQLPRSRSPRWCTSRSAPFPRRCRAATGVTTTSSPLPRREPDGGGLPALARALGARGPGLGRLPLRLGAGVLDGLRIKHPRLSEPLDYGA